MLEQFAIEHFVQGIFVRIFPQIDKKDLNNKCKLLIFLLDCSICIHCTQCCLDIYKWWALNSLQEKCDCNSMYGSLVRNTQVSGRSKDLALRCLCQENFKSKLEDHWDLKDIQSELVLKSFSWLKELDFDIIFQRI